MTRVDFYVLPDDTDSGRIELICRLAEKAYRQSQSVYIHTEDESMAALIDNALWQFRKDSFVPHVIAAPNELSLATEPVVIGYHPDPDATHTVLINVGQSVPAFFSRFERTLEVVNQKATVRASGRARYSFYQQRGYPLQHHKI